MFFFSFILKAAYIRHFLNFCVWQQYKTERGKEGDEMIINKRALGFPSEGEFACRSTCLVLGWIFQ